MPDDVLINKAEIIERCLKRIHEIYDNKPANLHKDQLRQDAILLNVERACQAAIDAGMRIVRLRALGIPKESKECFALLETAQVIPTTIALSLRKMVGFRNIAVHDYQKLDLNILQRVIASDFSDLRKFVALIIIF